MITLLLALTASVSIDRGQRYLGDRPYPLGPIGYVASVDGGPDRRVPLRTDVAPGAHSVTVWARTLLGKRFPASTTVTVGEGATARLQVNEYQPAGGAGFMFGAIGAVIQGAVQPGTHPHGMFVEPVR